MSRRVQAARAVAVFTVLGALALVPAVPAVATSAPTASAARSCSVGSSRGIGFSYVLKISASGTSCSTAKSTIRGYHSCKPHGGSCGHEIHGFRCHDKRLDSSASEFDARGTCSKHGASVGFTYTQFR
jgi:hypothetical protein